MSFGKTPNSPGLGGSIVDPLNSTFNNMPFVNNDVGQVGLDTARSKHAPSANNPTIAAVNPKTDLPTAVSQTGSNAQSLPQMLQMLNYVRSMMNMNNSGGNNNTSPNNSAISNLSGINQTVCTALTDTLSEISDNISLQNVIQTLKQSFEANSYYNLNPNYEATVSQAILQFISDIGENNLSYYIIPPANILSNVSISNSNLSNSSYMSTYTTANVVIISTSTVIPSPIVTSVPNYYTQEYYSIASDPTPGFVEWLSSDGTNNTVYTIRTQNQPNYESSENALLGETEIYLYDVLYPYFFNNNLNVSVLNSILDSLFPIVQTSATNNVLGQNSSSNILGMALQILGVIGSMINASDSEHLPNSVLNQNSMSNTLQSFTKNISVLQQMKNKSSGAFDPQSLLSSLGGGTGGIDISQLSSSIGTGSSSSSPNQISQASYNNITSISNNVSNNTLSVIASVTLQLHNSDVSQDIINNVQILLSEIIQD